MELTLSASRIPQSKQADPIESSGTKGILEENKSRLLLLVKGLRFCSRVACLSFAITRPT